MGPRPSLPGRILCGSLLAALVFTSFAGSLAGSVAASPTAGVTARAAPAGPGPAVGPVLPPSLSSLPGGPPLSHPGPSLPSNRGPRSDVGGPALGAEVPVKVGTGPAADLYDPVNGHVYVANYASDNVSVINENTVIASIPVGGGPEALAFDASDGSVYVVNGDTDNVSVISGTTVTGTVDVGSAPTSITYAANGELYVTNSLSNNVTVIGVHAVTNVSYVVKTIPVGTYPYDAVYDGGNGYVYVGNLESYNVSVIANGSVIRSIFTDTDASRMTYDPLSGYVFVLNADADYLTVVLGTSIHATVYTGLEPYAATVDPHNGLVYVSNAGSDTVSVLNNTFVVATIDVGVFPDISVYDSALGYVYVLNPDSDNVSVLSGGTVLESLDVGSLPVDAVYDSDNGCVYVVNYFSNNLTVLNAQSYAVTLPPGGSGLPTGAQWSLAIGGVHTNVSAGGIASISVPDGTYHFLVRGPKGYDVSDLPPTGNITVNGTTVTADGGPLTAPVFAKGPTPESIFSRSGLPKGTSWCVTFSGLKECSTGSTVSVTNLTPATYAYSFAPVAGYTELVKFGGHAVPPVGYVTVGTKTLKMSAKFTRTTYALTFTESGLPAGKGWSVKVTGEFHGKVTSRTRHSKSTTITFLAPNGSFSYVVKPVKGYSGSGSGIVAVSGGPVTVPVTFVLTAGVLRPVGPAEVLVPSETAPLPPLVARDSRG